MTVRDDLIAAKALIAKPSQWCQRAYRDRHGRLCAIAAVRMAAGSNYREAREALFAQIIQPSPKPIGVGEFNDIYNHRTVMALFDRAIASQPVQP